MYGSTGAHYAYDALDNLTHVVAPGRNHYYCYDGSNRLTNIKTSGCSGTTVIGLGYDPQGNLSNKDGTRYAFDYGNRLRGVEYAGSTVEAYQYDGLGRRVLASSPAGTIASFYSRDGQLLYQDNSRDGQTHSYLYLAGSLVNDFTHDKATGAYANRYQHTDALGSPVAVTNGPRTVLERSEYEPYGKLLNRPLADGPGYTGHVNDAATGLSYMQQRYYDPGIGMFLSVDPVSALSNPVGAFNRYWYANNNPFKFIDPDGRQSWSGHLCDIGGCGGFINGDGAHHIPKDGEVKSKATDEGHHVYAVEPGQVRVVGWQIPGNHKGGAGFRVQIAETENKIRIYGHMDPKSIAVKVNDQVIDRQFIGNYADPTNGHSNGPHVHDQLMDFSQGHRRDVDPGKESPLEGDDGRVTTPFGVRDAMHPNAHQGTDWAY